MKKLFLIAAILIASTVAAAPEAVGAEPEMWSGDVAKFEKRMAARRETKDFEGIWVVPGFVSVGMAAEGDGYVGMVVSSENDRLAPGRVIIRVKRDGDGWQGTSYIGARPEAMPIELLADGYMLLGGTQVVRRAAPQTDPNPTLEFYAKVRQPRTPLFEPLNGRYRLRYTASLSDRIHGMAIDDIGLQPDFYLDPLDPALEVGGSCERSFEL